MSTLLFITCSNGLGHFKRVVHIADFILKKAESVSITVNCLESQYQLLQNWDKVKAIRSKTNFTFDFQPPNIQWHPAGGYDSRLLDWVNELDNPLVEQADAVVCDNMAGILARREDALLCGSFLWSEVLMSKFPDNPIVQSLHDLEVGLLTKHKPNMLCQDGMEMPYVSQYTRPVHFSWMAESAHTIPVRKKIENILVVSGETGAADDHIMSMISNLLAVGKYNIFTTKRLLKNKAVESSNLHEFSFEANAFLEIDLIIGRPGIGLLTDAVTYGIPIIMLSEPDNLEMMHNMSCVQSIGFGKALALNESLPTLVSEIQSNGSYVQMVAKLDTMKKDGIADAGNFILTHFNLN